MAAGGRGRQDLGGRERVASHSAAMSWGDSSLVRYHRRSEVVERSPATPESGSDLSLELLAIRSLRHPHRRPSQPFIGRGTTHEGGPSPGRLPEWRSWSTCRACFAVAKFRPSTRSFLFPAPTRATKTWFVHALTSPGSDEHHIAGFQATLPQDGLTASKYRERARSNYANAHDDGCRPSPPGNCPRVSTSIIAWSNVVCVCLRPPRPCRSCRESTSGSCSWGRDRTSYLNELVNLLLRQGEPGAWPLPPTSSHLLHTMPCTACVSGSNSAPGGWQPGFSLPPCPPSAW